MAASRFWTSRQELMPPEFPLTWATFRVQFPPSNPGEPDRNPWRNQKWKTLRYSFWWAKRAAQMKHARASVWMNTRWLAVSFEPGLVLGTGAHGEYSRLLQTGISHSSQSCQSGHSCVLSIPDLFFLFFFFFKYFQNGFQLKFFLL